MPRYIAYKLDDGTEIWVQAPDDFEPKGPQKTGSEENVIQAEKTFSESLEGVGKVAKQLREKLKDQRADEVEVKFSLTATGELGNFAIGKVGVEANYEVTLKWKNEEEASKEKPKGES